MKEMKDLEEPFKKPSSPHFELQPLSHPTSAIASPPTRGTQSTTNIRIHLPIPSPSNSFHLHSTPPSPSPNARLDKTNPHLNLASYQTYILSFYTRCIP